VAYAALYQCSRALKHRRDKKNSSYLGFISVRCISEMTFSKTKQKHDMFHVLSFSETASIALDFLLIK